MNPLCLANQTIYIKACFVPSSVTWCNVGTSCSLTGDSFNSDCGIAGVAEQFLSKLIPETFRCFNLVKECISKGTDAQRAGCDIVFGRYGEDPSDYWINDGIIYNTDSVSLLQHSNIGYSLWDFLRPFSLTLWLVILAVMLISTPLVMSIVEYDEGETIYGNFLRFLPDSVHAHTGIDILNNDLPDKNGSYILSIFVGIFSFITIAVYASNLIAFVLYKTTMVDMFLEYDGEGKIFVEKSVYSELPIKDSIPVPYFSIQSLHATGDFNFIVAENYLLRGVQQCGDIITPLRGVGVTKYLYIANKLGETAAQLLQDNISIRGLEYISDTNVLVCDETPRPVSISSIYGVFLMFFVPVTVIVLTIVVRIVASYRKSVI